MLTAVYCFEADEIKEREKKIFFTVLAFPRSLKCPFQIIFGPQSSHASNQICTDLLHLSWLDAFEFGHDFDAFDMKRSKSNTMPNHFQIN